MGATIRRRRLHFITGLGQWLRARETARRGYANLQTVSVFGPELVKHPALVETIFRHPLLDFANTHLYEYGTIDAPRDTVAPALAVARLMRVAVEQAGKRPVFDSEHGPIHSFKDKKRTLSEAFDDEYFRHIQWSHIASGGAGGGMRWPNRHPHVLTAGMREAQKTLAHFITLVDWARFRRRNLSVEMQCTDSGVAVVGCGDDSQAIAWMVRTDSLSPDGMLSGRKDAPRAMLTIPGLGDGHYSVVAHDTRGPIVIELGEATSSNGVLRLSCGPVEKDRAVVVRRTSRK